MMIDSWGQLGSNVKWKISLKKEGDCSCIFSGLYQDASFFFPFCICDNVICKAEVYNKSSADANIPSWPSNASHMILSMKMLKGYVGSDCISSWSLLIFYFGESCRTPTVVLDQYPVLPLNRTALWAFSHRFSMTRMMLALILCP